ncbi:hypothetical protein C8Q72DRAFT_300658 [Fomitopsis betulina]|nr:hypothetical protein C8Q72DRAFT_448949 [Fomitopsis betulina]KAI0729753.1 hypothetical protein C8Q72DRAFT_300658 [Fomitopsis betulina]
MRGHMTAYGRLSLSCTASHTFGFFQRTKSLYRKGQTIRTHRRRPGHCRSPNLLSPATPPCLETRERLWCQTRWGCGLLRASRTGSAAVGAATILHSVERRWELGDTVHDQLTGASQDAHFAMYYQVSASCYWTVRAFGVCFCGSFISHFVGIARAPVTHCSRARALR